VPLFGQLADHFGADRVFRDIDVIKPGDDFAERIQIALASCSVLLALIGEGWLTATDSSGRRRLDLPDDYVRLEIETALARGIVVIPVLVDGARMPRAADLPPGIRGLSGREALTLSAGRFTSDVSYLLAALDTALSSTPRFPPPGPPAPGRGLPVRALVAGGVACCAVLGTAGYLLAREPSGTRSTPPSASGRTTAPPSAGTPRKTVKATSSAHRSPGTQAPCPGAPAPALAAGGAPPVGPEITLHDPGGEGVYGIAFSSDGILAAGDLNTSVYLWNAAREQVTATLTTPNHQAVFDLAFSPDGCLVAAGTANSSYTNGSVYLWDVETGTLAATFSDPHSLGVSDVVFSPDGSTLAAADSNGGIFLWNVTTHRLTATLSDPGTRSDPGIAYSPGGTLAAADRNGNVYLRNTATGALAVLHDPGATGAQSVAFTRNGGMLAVGDDNGSVYLWNMATGALAATLRGPVGQLVYGVAFSPDGSVLAATTSTARPPHSSSICVWNVATGIRLATLHDPKGAGLFRLAFSPGGTTLAVGDENTNTYLWNMNWLGH